MLFCMGTGTNLGTRLCFDPGARATRFLLRSRTRHHRLLLRRPPKHTSTRVLFHSLREGKGFACSAISRDRWRTKGFLKETD
jgi:hypothetical protein